MPAGSMRPCAMAASMPLTSFGAAAEMRWTLATGMSAARCFEMAAHGALQVRQRGGEHGILRDAVAEAREQLLRSLPRDRCRARVPSCMIVLPATISSLMWRAVERANKQVERIEVGRSRSSSSLLPVEQQNVGGRARRERAAFVPVGDRAAAVDQDRVEDLLARNLRLEADRAMQQIGEPHFAQRVVVLVERRAIEPERDAAAAPDHLRQRRDAGAQMQVRRGVDRNGDAALREQLQFIRPRPGAMRQRERARSGSRSSRDSARCRREIHDRPSRADSASPADACGCAGRSPPRPRRRLEQFVACTTAPRPDRTAHRRSRSGTRPRRRRPARSAPCTGNGLRMKRRVDLGTRLGRQRREDRLGRAVDQRIAVAQRRREADAHADIGGRARDLLRLGHIIGQALRARVVHHHAAGAAAR